MSDNSHSDDVLAQLRLAESNGELPDEIAARHDLDDTEADE